MFLVFAALGLVVSTVYYVGYAFMWLMLKIDDFAMRDVERALAEAQRKGN